ncbi:MAG: glutaredoxin [Desulfomonile tiedjei]|nr:glutaredoxin [Desulfomonile tiedjei]
MIRLLSLVSRGACVAGVLLLLIAPHPWSVASEPADAPKGNKTVWVVFFSSQGCPHCGSAKDLIAAMKAKYPIRTKVFDVDRSEDYRLFRRLERIHSSGKFAVPLIMVGESILEGEAEIAEKLEATVRRLARSGGAGLPYLGSASTKRAVADKSQQNDSPRENRVRPPTVGEEWKKIRTFLNKWLP